MSAAGQFGRVVLAVMSVAALSASFVAQAQTGAADTGHRVCGRVGDDDFAYADELVTLQPGVLTTRTDASGRFCFEDVADGEHVVGVAEYCRHAQACFPNQPITVHGADVAIDFVPQPCLATVLRVYPLVAAPGTEVEVAGFYYYLHSGGGAPLYLDGIAVAGVGGDTGGCLRGRFRVPLTAIAGPHRVAVPLSFPIDEAAATLRVPGVPGGCPGDCEGDDIVTITDLLRGIGVALGTQPLSACPAIDRSGDGTAMIDELAAAVGRALAGCPALFTPASLEAVYDVTATFARRGNRRGLAIVQAADDGDLSIRMIFDQLHSIGVSGALAADGTAQLQGGSISGGDIYSPAVGEVAADLGAPAQRLDGSLEIDEVFDGAETVTFALRRPESGTPDAFYGYRLTLEHTPSSGVAFRSALGMYIAGAAPRGLATCGGGDHFDEADHYLPGLARGPCAVSPEGRFSFFTQYEEFTNAGGPPIHLFGTLSETGSAGSGTGSFTIGAFPSVLDQGIWTAQQPASDRANSVPPAGAPTN